MGKQSGFKIKPFMYSKCVLKDRMKSYNRRYVAILKSTARLKFYDLRWLVIFGVFYYDILSYKKKTQK